MHVYIFMHVSAYACIRMHGMHIPLAGAAHQGGYVGGWGGTTDPGPWHIYMYIYIYTHICKHIAQNHTYMYIYTYKYATNLQL